MALLGLGDGLFRLPTQAQPQPRAGGILGGSQSIAAALDHARMLAEINSFASQPVHKPQKVYRPLPNTGGGVVVLTVSNGPLYSPSLDFSDDRNSMYIPLGIV